MCFDPRGSARAFSSFILFFLHTAFVTAVPPFVSPPGASWPCAVAHLSTRSCAATAFCHVLRFSGPDTQRRLCTDTLMA